MNINVSTCVLPSNLNREVVIRFINKYHKMAHGNITLMTIRNYNIFTRLGTVCSYLTNGNILIGILFSIVVKLNLGVSSYTTYLCVRPDYRGKGLAVPMIQSSINFGARFLNLKHGYYLVNKVRRKGCRLNSWYRILNQSAMKDSGFTILDLSYSTSLPEGVKVKKGLYTDMYIDNLTQIHWKPDNEELERYKNNVGFYTIYQDQIVSAIFIITPLECIISSSGKKVTMAMLTYYHSITGNNDNNLAAVIHTAAINDYECLYGYILGDITKDIIRHNDCHITDSVLYLEFFNHPYDEINPADINIPLF